MDKCPKKSIAKVYETEDNVHDNKAFVEYELHACVSFTKRSDGTEYKEVGAFRTFFSGFFKTKIDGTWRYECERGKVKDMFNMLISGVKAPRKYDTFESWKSKHNMMLGSAVLEVLERADLLDVLVAHIQENVVKRFSVLDTVAYLLEREGKATKCKDLDDAANKYLPEGMHEPNAKEVVPEDWDASDDAALRDNK